MAAAAHAFGLRVASGYELPGIPSWPGPFDAGTAPGTVVLEQSGEEAIECDWSTASLTRVSEWRDEEGRCTMQLDGHPQLGYRWQADTYGSHELSWDGTRVRSAPADVEPWRWQRLLIGQILPFAALIQGLEVFHASAVAIGERAYAFVGRTRAGKSSVAAQLLLRDARFFTDDVLAVTIRDSNILAHPGPGVTSVRFAELERLGNEVPGRKLGADDQALRVSVEPFRDALPLGGIYFLERGGTGTDVEIKPVEPPAWRLLLASTFNLVLTGPERLRTQLELSAEVASRIPLCAVRSPSGSSAADVADAVLDHATAQVRVHAAR